MPDVLTPAQRRFNMSRIRGKDTIPEIEVRRIVYAMGYRYRLHRRDLPGRPDLAFASRRKVIFVHGCFWHRHSCRFGLVIPQTNAVFWEAKINGNVERDERNLGKLSALGWESLVIWECELKDEASLRRRLARFLTPSSDPST